MTSSPTRKRALDLAFTMLPKLQCMSAAQAVEQLPALKAFRTIVRANVAVASDTTNRDLERAREAEALRFFDTALDECHNTINVIVGGCKSGKMTKLRALVHMCDGRARFFTGDLFRDELRAQANIVLHSRERPIVVIAGRDLPPQDYDDDRVSLGFFYNLHERRSTNQREILGGGGNKASVALAIDDESDLVKLASLGVRINVLRLDGDDRYSAPAAASDAFVDVDNAAVYLAVDGREHLPQYISHVDMLPLLSAGGALFAAWRALVCAKRALDAIQREHQQVQQHQRQ
jgi:hypothetical protein